MTQAHLSPSAIGLPRLGVRRRLVDAVSDALRDAITSGALAPGARLREVEFAKHFQVSATPVREAIRRLEREGLVEVSPHRGATVATFTPGEIAHLYEIHELLESYAVRRAAEADDIDLSRLETLLAETENLLTQPEPDQLTFNRLDLAFHRTLNELSGNLPLADHIEQIHSRIQGVRVRAVGHLPGRPAQSHAQHLKILAAVRDRDPDRAETFARCHIRSVRDAVLRVLDDTRHAAGKEEMTATATAPRSGES